VTRSFLDSPSPHLRLAATRRGARRVAPRFIITLAVLALTATSGCAIATFSDPRLVKPCQFHTDEVRICVSADAASDSFNLPLLWHSQQRGAPFGLTIRVTDLQRRHESAAITSIRIEYADGQVVELNEPHTAQLELDQAGHFGHAVFSLPQAVERSQSCSIVIAGELRSPDGSVRLFSDSHALTIESQTQSLFYYTWLAWGIT
jgi:hypothetical protein